MFAAHHSANHDDNNATVWADKVVYALRHVRTRTPQDNEEADAATASAALSTPAAEPQAASDGSTAEAGAGDESNDNATAVAADDTDYADAVRVYAAEIIDTCQLIIEKKCTLDEQSITEQGSTCMLDEQSIT